MGIQLSKQKNKLNKSDQQINNRSSISETQKNACFLYSFYAQPMRNEVILRVADK